MGFLTRRTSSHLAPTFWGLVLFPAAAGPADQETAASFTRASMLFPSGSLTNAQ